MSAHPTSPDPRPSFAPALLAGIGTLLLWSGTPIANKVAVTYMDGFTAGVLRSTVAGAIAFAVALALRLPFPTAARDRSLLALAGIASFAAWPVTMSVGIELTTAGHTALILATIPIIAVLIACALERRLPRAGWWLGAALALAGCGALVAGQTGYLDVPPDGSSLVGDLIVFAGCAVCAVGYVAGGRLAPKIGTSATTFWGLSIAMVVLVPLLIAVQARTEWTGVAADGWLAMGWLALLSSLVAYALWFFALGRGGIGRISSLLLVMPAITVLGAAMVLEEPISWLLLASCGIVVLGTYLAQRHAR